MEPRALTALALLVAVAGCRSSGPPSVSAPPALPPPEFIRGYVAQRLILRHHGASQRLELGREELARPSGDCDVAVEVARSGFENGTAVFTLEALGSAGVEGRLPAARSRGSCGTVSAYRLSISGFTAGQPPEEIRAELSKVLATPEEYLAARGMRFDPARAGNPRRVASQEPNATVEEQRLAAQVTAWPRALLRVQPTYNDPSGRVRHEGEVAFGAVVGEDGRLRDPKLRTPLSAAHEGQVLRALSLWRFEPAQGSEGPLAARISASLTFRIY